MWCEAMSASTISTSAAPPKTRTANAFLRRLTAATGGGMFLDGFVFAAIAAVIAGKAFTADLHLSSTTLGLISASTLIGTIIGGPLIGYLTDIIGRRPMFIADLCIFLACALFMLVVNAGWEVVVLGVFLGMAIGGDYAIGSPLLGEFMPARKRGHYLGLLEILWNVGYVVSFLIGFLVLHAYPQAWHIVLASAAVPAALILLMRHGLPESPRWLLSKGRTEQAQQILAELGENRDTSEFDDEAEEKTRWITLLDRAYLARTTFCCVFWMCIVIPYFALAFFQSEVLGVIGLENPVLAALLGTCVALLGAAIGWFLIDRVGRRLILIVPMFATGVFLAVVALNKALHLSIAVTVVCFFGYLLFYGVMSILPGVYPLEVFPTTVRTSGMGLSSAASRVGAAIATFLLPVSLATFGLSPVLLALAAVCVIGGVTSVLLAPETAGKTLTETGSRTGTDKRVLRVNPLQKSDAIQPSGAA